MYDFFEGVPGKAASVDLGEQVGYLDRRCDVLTGALVDAEAPGSLPPAQQVRHGLTDLLVHEGLDDRLIDVAEVHEQLTEAPALELGALRLEGVAEGLRGEGSGGDEPGAELWSTTRDDNGVHPTAAQEDLALLYPVVDVQAAAGHPVGKLREDRGNRGAAEVSLEHARPPSWLIDPLRHV